MSNSHNRSIVCLPSVKAKQEIEIQLFLKGSELVHTRAREGRKKNWPLKNHNVICKKQFDRVMKHSIDDSVLQTNLLQAFQKNKLVQSKLNERQRSHHVEFVKEMQDHQLKEKLNRELLYTWKKENYVRQLKKNLREYERKRFGMRDAFYEYQVRNLQCIISGQQGLTIPPIEEERRLNVNAKFNQFLHEHPLTSVQHNRRTKVSETTTTAGQSAIDAEEVEKTWNHIHAVSAFGLKRKTKKTLPEIQRAATLDEIPRHQPAKEIVTELPTDAQEETFLPVLPVAPIQSSISDEMEPVQLSSDILDRQTRADLVAMRSVRRAQKNPIDLNITFESRKRIYQINKRVYDYRICPRKCNLQYKPQFDRAQPVEPADDDENLLLAMSDTTRRRYEDRHQADKNFI